MNRSVRRSRFQVSSLEEGEPRPVYRRLTFISVELGQSMPPAGDAIQVRALVARPVKALMPESLPGCEPPAASLRLQEDLARHAVARKWAASAEAVIAAC